MTSRRLRAAGRRLALEPLEERALLDAAGIDADAFAPPAEFSPPPIPPTTVVPGELLVKLRDPDALNPTVDDPAGPVPASIGPVVETASLWTELSASRVRSIEPVFPSLVTEAAAYVASAETAEFDAERADLALWYRLELPNDADVEEAAAAFNGLPEVMIAEPNYEYRLAAQIDDPIFGIPDATTDPLYDDQWHHTNTKTPNAWLYLDEQGVYPGGDHSVVVAVLDSGVDYTHEDLAANMWVNADEIPDNGVDDDDNGFVDDIHGATVVSNPSLHHGDPMDVHGHGTHCAGIVASQGFNEIGGVGTAFNVQIMAVRAAQYAGTLTVQDIAEGVTYAVDNGADVISMSFGGYQRSQIMLDALEVALNKCVLVAAAGNDNVSIRRAPNYPAAFPIVVGVEATTPDDRKAWFSNYGYDVRAPGVGIPSTLPLVDNYAAWSGTSMATPIVAGIAALARSYFWQRDIYSSRFIQGCLTHSSMVELGLGGILDETPRQGVVDAYRVLTDPPKPGVVLYENWLFDDPAVDEACDDDGRIDAGETVHIGVELINRSGSAENVRATLRAHMRGAYADDPFVTIHNDTVTFGDVGPFAITDNGLTWDNEGVLSSVSDPFVVQVDPSCPNDHVIPFELTVTFEDGWDEDHPTYKRVSRFSYIVQRGVNVPRVVSEDMTLTADNLWIVGSPVLIEEQATLRIEEGVELQFGGISDDPYNPGPQNGNIVVRGDLIIEGTQQQPVTIFPSYLVSGQQTSIEVQGGHANIQYATIRNPRMTGLDEVDHCYVDWDYYNCQFQAQYIANTIFHKYRGSAIQAGSFDTVLFDESRATAVGYGNDLMIVNSTFLQDNQENQPLTLSVPLDYHEELTELQSKRDYYTFLDPRYHEGYTYVVLPMEWDSTALAELIANYFEGHVVSVHSDAETEWLVQYISYPKPRAGHDGFVSFFLLGATTMNAALDGNTGTWDEYRWVDGTPMDYTNWGEGQPADLLNTRPQEIYIAAGTGLWSTRLEANGGRWGGHGHPRSWPGYILKLPGEWTFEQLMATYNDGRLLEHVEQNYHGPVRYNALLSKSWDPNINHWMTIRPAGGSPAWTSEIAENYWGTDNPELVQHMVYDYFDNFVTAAIDYGTPPEHGYESTFPFVDSVEINGTPGTNVPDVGAGPATFAVSFNRPMDPTVQPSVTFGPITPFTDFEVHPIGTVDAVFTVELSQPASQTVTVDYTTVDGTAVGGVDYETTAGTLTFDPGETQQVVEVPVLGDIWEETDKAFSLELSEPTFVTLADDAGQGTILDDDPTLSIADAAIIEGDAGTADVLFTVTLAAAVAEEVTVYFATEDGSAIAGTDYQETKGTLTFAPGETVQSLAVPVIGNVLHQGDRTFAVELTHPRRASIAENRAEGTIRDDDPLVRIDDVIVTEPESGTADATFTVSLSTTPLKTITVDYATADDTATAGSDYQATSGTLTFEASGASEQTVAVPIHADAESEILEHFRVNLSNIDGAMVADDTGLGAIIPHGAPLASVSDVTLTEGHGEASLWSTYLGGDVRDWAYGVDLDAAGNFWISGATESADFPIVDGVDPDFNGADDAFVAKLSPAGEVLFSTYLGSGCDEVGRRVVVDDAGDVYVGGYTGCSTWITETFENSPGGHYDAFLAKFTGDGDLLWLKKLGGPNPDYLTDLELDAAGNVYLVGHTDSPGWASGGHDDSYNGSTDAFAAKVSPDGQLLWSTYLGGSVWDVGRGIGVDAAGNSWVVGGTRSSAWAAGGFNSDHGGNLDGFVARLDPDGQLLEASYLGGSNDDDTYDVTVDDWGDAWVCGMSHSAGWISDGFDTVHGGGYDAFVMKIDNAGQPLWSSYLGGGGREYGYALDVDRLGSAWIVGRTNSGGWVSGGIDTSHNGHEDPFVARIAGSGQFLWSSYIGGSASNDYGHGIVTDGSGSAYVVGETDSPGWISGGPDTSFAGAKDAFLLKIGDNGTTDAEFAVNLSADPETTLTIDYATEGLSAAADSDYRPINGTFTFRPGGPLQQRIAVPVLGNRVSEPDETFRLRITSLEVGLADPIGEATIINDDPAVSIDDVTLTEGDAGTVDAVFTVSISLPPEQAAAIDYTTADGTATAGEDYQAVAGTLTFEPGGPADQTITVPVLADLIDELDEDFTVELTSSTAIEIVDAVGQGTIVDDDAPIFTIDDVTIVEGDAGEAEAVFTVTLSVNPDEQLVVRYETVDDTATAGEDYRPTSGALFFKPGHPLSQQVGVDVFGDATDELDEEFLLRLFDADGATIVKADGLGTVRDDDPKISIDDVTVLEDDAGTIEAAFTVSLSAVPAQTLTVDYATTDGTATAGEDYTATAGQLTFLPGGELAQTVSVTVSGDLDDETNETFTVELSNASDAAIADASGLGTIVGDDGPLLSIADAQFVEGDAGTSYAQFTVTLSGQVPQRVQVDYATADGTATAGEDYNAVTGSLVFDPDDPLQQTLLVPIVGDLDHEGDETVLVDLVGATVVGIADSRATGTITGDDPVLSIDDVALTEGNSGNPLMQFTVTISQDPIDPVTVDFATADGTATTGVDYLPATGTLTFTPGGALQQTIDVFLISDVTNETHETFRVDLSNATGTAEEPYAKQQGIATITDDDGAKLSIDDVTLAEGDAGTSEMIFTVSLSQPHAATVTVDYATEDGTAVAGTDYQTAGGTLTFEPGGPTEQTVAVPIVGDVVDEIDENLFVALSNAAGVPVQVARGEGTIDDDDSATLSIDDVTVDEGYDGWINSRTWQGSFWITPMTGESYHEMRISGAAAADDPWLVSGWDIGRFRFRVQTMGVQSMTLHAAGQEGSVHLAWAQDDFDLLAGYNLYRSDSAEGTYQRLNETIIPVGNEAFVDADVTPAVPMHYMFTVMTTDGTESDPSNIASAAAVDTVVPVVVHVPVTAASAGFGLRLVAEITDNLHVAEAAVHYRPLESSDDYIALAMVNLLGNSYSATIAGGEMLPPGIEYYITASDGQSTTYDGTPALPHLVTVETAPSVTSVTPNQGPSAGGTSVTVTGTQFQDGLAVYFGDVAATDVVVVTDSQIACTTPAHFPALADVRVVNADTSEATLLSGFRYVDETVVLSLPEVSGDFGTFVSIPLTVSNVDGLRAADLTITYDPSVLALQDVTTGPLAAGWACEANTTTPGTIVVSMATGMPVSGEGILLDLDFEVVGDPLDRSDLLMTTVLLNDGAILANVDGGWFTVAGSFSIAGTARYFTGNGPVPGVAMTLSGAGLRATETAADGSFAIDEITFGSYTLRPTKGDQVDGIMPYDAALVLRAAAGLGPLSAHQIVAADVNSNGSVNAMDASYILSKSVGLIEGTFPGAGRYWTFLPEQRTYPQLDQDQTGQDFTAILLGDVSGNWQVPGAASADPAEETVATASLALAAVAGVPGQPAEMPLRIELAEADVYSADLVLRYDAEALTLLDVSPGAAAGSLAFAANTTQPGTIRVGLAAGAPWTTGGTLLELSFDVTGSLATPAAVTVEAARLNEDTIPVAFTHGEVHQAVSTATVVGRHVFYNNSSFDGQGNDGAIAPDKQALLHGQTATLAHYTNYSLGINGVMVDVDGLPEDVVPDVDDFRLAVGNHNDLGSWQPAPAPIAVTMRENAGVDGSDRVTIVWEDRAVMKQWLQVTVLAEPFGLAADDVFYFGNAVADAGNSETDARVTTTDLLLARNNPHSFLNPAALDYPYDYNRDQRVNATDLLLARNNQTNFLNALQMLDLTSIEAEEEESPPQAAEAVDKLLATYRP